MTEMAFPPMVTGTSMGAMAWVPPRRLSSPPVVPVFWPPALPLVPVVASVDALVDSLSPMTEMAFPPMVTGTSMGATTCVPPATLSSPDVTAAVLSASVCEPLWPVDASVDSLSPRTETALPLTVTGASTETTPCVPPATLSSPEVEGSGAGCDEPPDDDSAPSEWLSPATETALPATVTGTSTVTIACDPEAAPSFPEVCASGAGAGADAWVSGSSEWESPRTEMALPATVTGASTSMTAWVPESSPSSPDVSAAWATPAPAREIPPPMSTPHRARLMIVCMTMTP